MQEANCISTCLVFLRRLERAPVLADSLIMVPNDSSKVWWFLNMENCSQTFLVRFKFRSCFGQSGWWFLEKLKCLYVSPVWEEEHGILCQKEGVSHHDGFCPKVWCFASSFPPPSPSSPNFLFNFFSLFLSPTNLHSQQNMLFPSLDILKALQTSLIKFSIISLVLEICLCLSKCFSLSYGKRLSPDYP